MINGRHVIAVVPARGGSKGLPGKNIRALCGKPLIVWTLDKAHRSKYVDVVLVTTDSHDIAAIARDHAAYVPFLRPAELATDDASTFDVVKHALDFLKATDDRVFDYIVLLEPTSPLREDDDIDRMLEQIEARAAEFDAIVSVGEVHEHPSIMKRFAGERLEPFASEIRVTTRRQDNDPAYFPYGVAYIVKSRTLLEERTFYPRRCMGHAIKRYQAYEIDDIFDFLCVEAVMRHAWGMT